jgi:TP901 family phage tail tape measure protein
MPARTAEVIFVGDAESLVRAALRSTQAVTDAANKMVEANQRISASARAAGQVAARAAAQTGASMEEQARVAGRAAAAQAKAVGDSAKAQELAYARSADAARAAAIKQSAAAQLTMRSIASTASTIGRSITTYISVPVALAAGYGAKLAIDYEASMLKIRTQAGATRQELQNMTKDVRELAGTVQFGPVQLSNALYQLESVGQRGALALHNLKVAAVGAAMGSADLEATTSALAAVTTAYNVKARESQKYMAEIDATVGVGKMRMEELVGSYHTGILPVAQAAGLSFRSLGAALAVMTDRGVPAARAMQYLRQAIFYLSSESTKAAKEDLAAIGLTSQEVADQLKGPNGLDKAVVLIAEHLKGLNTGTQLEVLKNLGGGARSATGLITVFKALGASISNTEEKYRKIGQITHTWASREEEQARSLEGQLRKAWSAIQAALLELGESVGPVFAAMAKGAASVAKYVGEMPAPIKTAGIAVAIFVAATGPLLIAFGAMSRAILAISALFGKMGASAQAGAGIVDEAMAGMAAATTAAAGEMEAAFSGIDAAVAAAGGTITTVDSEIIAANDAVTASFGRILGVIRGGVGAGVLLGLFDENPLGLLGLSNPTGGPLSEKPLRKGGLAHLAGTWLPKGTEAELLQQSGGMMAWLEKRGLTAKAAAGLVGNAMMESNLNPHAPGGLFQMSGYPASYGTGSTTHQLEMLWKAMQGMGGLVGDLNKAGTATAAAKIFMERFERPKKATEHKHEREQWAYAFLTAHHPAAYGMGSKAAKELSRALEHTNQGTQRKFEEEMEEATGKNRHKKLPVESYVNPFVHAREVHRGRTDMGIDFTAAPGSPIAAIGKGVIDKIVQNWYKGQPLIEERLTQGAHKGQYVYYAEQLTPGVRQGQLVKAGQRIGVVAPHGTGLELGFGAGHGRTLAQVTTGYTEGKITPAGKNFEAFLNSIGHGGSNVSVLNRAYGEQLKRLAALQKEHEKRIETQKKAGEKELRQMEAAIQSGSLKELNKLLSTKHEHSLGKLEQTLSKDHVRALDHLNARLITTQERAEAARSRAWHKAMEEWHEAMTELGERVKGLVEQAVESFSRTRLEAITSKHETALKGIEHGPEAEAAKREREEGEAEQEKQTEEANAERLKEAKKRLEEAKHNENPKEVHEAQKEVEDAERAITQFARDQDIKRREKKVEEERKAADESQETAETQLEHEVKAYEESLKKQADALTANLEKGLLKYREYVDAVNALLANSGLALKYNPNEAVAVIAPPAPSAPGGPPVVVGTELQRITKGHASGGPVYPGISYLVGETGREVFTPDAAGSITPASRAQPGGVKVEINGPVAMGGRGDAERFAQRLAQQIAHGGH